jgi:hypothetical protein
MKTKSAINTSMRLCLLLLTLGFPAVNARADNLDSLILGKWTYSMTARLPAADGALMEFSGNEEYFPNKTCSTNGTVTLTGKFGAENKLRNMEIVCDVRVAAEWSIIGGIVYNKITDSAVALKKLVIDGETITDKEAQDIFKKEIEKMFLKGETSPIKTISIDANKWVREEEIDEKGKTVVVKATRP